MKSKIFVILGSSLSICLSIVIFIITFLLIQNYTLKGFSYGKEFSKSFAEEKPSEIVNITLDKDMSLDEVSKLLEKEGVISNAFVFKIENLLKGYHDKFLAGTYVVNKNMDNNKLNTALRTVINSNTDDDIKAIIKEGFTLKDIAEYLESLEVVDAKEFLEVAKSESFDYYFFNEIPERENRLEGYLFPDTYFFLKDSNPKTVINKILSRFDDIYNEEYIKRADELGMTIDEVIIRASIIEKEVRVNEERKKVASVINNRLNSNMRLEMCSTVLYALDKRKDRLFLDDLKVDSPYNTYIKAGLPIGPISNPGEECIRAVLYPDETNYIYFVVKDEERGDHFFTNNYNEFLNAKDLYNQQF